MNIRVDVQEVFAAVFWIDRLFPTQIVCSVGKIIYTFNDQVTRGRLLHVYTQHIANLIVSWIAEGATVKKWRSRSLRERSRT